jgi:AraC-like DNA-binding protein
VANFFDYFPVSARTRSWGLYATSFGQVRVPPNVSYPLGHHPESHLFDWGRGRILPEYQVLYVREGRGIFESAAAKSRKIGPGTVFILFPGVWHRYRPEPATGWTESWIELDGAYIDQLRKSKVIDPKNPVYRVHSVEAINEIFDAAHFLARSKPPGFAVRLGLLAVQALTLVRASSPRTRAAPRRIDDLVSQAQAQFAQNFASENSAEATARQLGVGYSYFRREFKRQTGFSPKQYRLEIRHRQAKDLLRTSSLTIKEISERLGYHSPYHLSLEFAKRTGLPPTKWRSRRGAAPPGV